MDIVVWIITLAVFVLIEIATVNLVTIWFSIGSLAAIICAICGANVLVQVIVFIVVSVVALVFTKPFVNKFLSQKKESTNFDRIIGMEGIVTENISSIVNKGYISVDGKEWMARTDDGMDIPVGTKVSVLRIDGAKVYVKKAK